ncbi:MAG: hypothetical protein IKQ31_01885 [Clostridia bacterium]|nr:hypothetical protein [Clostridia bacterium]
MRFTSRGKVSASMCDSEAKLSLLGAVQLIQDYVSELFGIVKVDQTTMKNKHGAMWVFTKNRVKIERQLRWDEEFEVSCFVSCLTPVRMVVETIFEHNKQIILVSQIEACAVDISTQKIRRITSEIISKNFVEVSTEKLEFSRLNMQEMESEAIDNEVVIGSTCIDFCKHTNNTEYVRFVLNTFSVIDLKEHPIKLFEICYLSQTFEGDKLQILKKQERNITDIVLRKGAENVVLCRLTQEI